MNKRETLAREMAEKSGYDYDKSGKMMQNAWLHNADTEINRSPEVEIPAKIVIEDGVKVTAQETLPRDDDGDETNKPSKPEAPPTETPRELKPGEYLCSKCNTPHRKNSNIGKKHLKRQ